MNACVSFGIDRHFICQREATVGGIWFASQCACVGTEWFATLEAFSECISDDRRDVLPGEVNPSRPKVSSEVSMCRHLPLIWQLMQSCAINFAGN